MYRSAARSSLESVQASLFSSRNALTTVHLLLGRELGSYALDEYTSVKAIHWNFGEKLEWPL